MIYAKAAKRFAKTVREVVHDKVEQPWKDIDNELKETLKASEEDMKTVAEMCDGFLFSLTFGGEMADQLARQQGLEEDQIGKFVAVAMMDVVSTALLRAFALGVHAQKAVSEVELLESLAEAE